MPSPRVRSEITQPFGARNPPPIVLTGDRALTGGMFRRTTRFTGLRILQGCIFHWAALGDTGLTFRCRQTAANANHIPVVHDGRSYQMAIRPRPLLSLAAIGLAAMLTGCVAYPAYPAYPGYGYGYGYGYGAPVYVGVGGGWHDHGWR
jgi:hypothetical protein